jgi:hypothetical protein
MALGWLAMPVTTCRAIPWSEIAWVARVQARMFQFLMWMLLVASTIWFIVGLIHPAAGPFQR